jgi:hypothetical protein
MKALIAVPAEASSRAGLDALIRGAQVAEAVVRYRTTGTFAEWHQGIIAVRGAMAFLEALRRQLPPAVDEGRPALS